MPIQDTRKMVLETPLGKDKLLLQQMNVREELGRPYEIRIVALSEDHNLKLNTLLGESITVSFEAFGGKLRYFNGLVSRFSHMTSSSEFAQYEIVARPWLWFLTRNSDCRIFQEMTVPDIIKQVFRDRGFSDFEDRLKDTYRPWEYCVQYRETDFNFVSRLMEQEGIYYYFEHGDKTHSMILSDSYSAHDTVTDYDEVPYFPRVKNQSRERDHVFDWNVAQQVQSGKYAIDDYDFKNPTSDLIANKETARDHALSSFEIYDYPGEYVKKSDGTQYVQVRNEELHALYERAQCAGNARGLACGALFTLKQYPRDDQNREYLIVSASHRLVSDDYASGGGASEDPYDIEFVTMVAKQPFRSTRATPKPMVQGPQTAVVVGKAGEEIWCDEFGRVKVQFHWDRYGSSDENSSCWVRVSQVWAGVKWGAMHIPRMGQEVIVDFLEGDPDQPIITGRVYNGDNMPPYELPGSQTQSGIKSRSTKGGGTDNFNEIYFEDKKGEEEMYIHAEKDQNTVVENNQTITVGFEDTDPGDRELNVHHNEKIGIGNNRDKVVGVDQTETIGKNKQIRVGANHTETVAQNVDISIGAALSESVGANASQTVAVAKTVTVGAAFQISVGGAMNTSVGGAIGIEVGGLSSESVGAAKTVSVVGTMSQDVGGAASTNVGSNDSLTVGGKRDVEVTKEYNLKAKKINLEAEDEIILKAGKAQISMKKNGDIEISGAGITVKGSKKIDIKASKDLTLKGSKIKEN